MRPEDMIGQILGHYRLIRSLGYGGSATVFLAEDINLQREVAVKVFMPREGDTHDFLRRFAREARVLAQLDHPHILPVYEYGEQDGRAYLVMPHMAGGSLRDWLRWRGATSAEETVHLMSQILSALQYAHERNLIHRDIKPGNMLFKADGTLMLSDFGLVKVLAANGEDQSLLSHDASRTAPAITGTPDYMAPEQISGKVVPASDIYAMGVVLYEMLTGKHLFEADNYMGILVQHLYEQPRPLRAINPHISADLEAVVLHALIKDPTRRYQRPIDLLQALQQASASEPSAASRTITIRPTPSLSTPLPPTQSQQDDSITYRSDAATPNPPLLDPVTMPSTQTPQAGSQPRRSNIPLRVALILIVLVLLTTVSGVLYTQGIFGSHNTPHNNPSPTAITQIPNGNTVISAPVPQTQTSCPAPGQARAAITAPLALGDRQNVVYIVNEGTTANPLAGTIKRREANPSISSGVEISKIPHAYISEAQVSQDSRWVIFVAAIAGQSQLRMVRVDGEGLQTVYCAPANATISHSQWSFDQRTVIFNAGPASGKPTTYLLDIVSGTIQPELIGQSNLGYYAQTWLDNTHVYIVSFVPNSDGGPQDIYLLDIKKGANQHDGNLQKIVARTQTCGSSGSFDTSYDSQQLLLSSCNLAAPTGGGLPAPVGPSSISSQPATGGSLQKIHTLPQAVTMLRAVSPTTVLLLVENYSADTSQNGLWKVNTDGTGLMRLSTDKHNMQSLCQFTQYAWSNVSRDGQFYALQEVDVQSNTYTMYYGSMSGGTPPTQFAGIQGTQLLLAGWISL